MANTNNPFAGGGGYGSIIPDEYQQVSSNVGDAYIARENKRLDSLQSALNSVIGMGARAGGADAGMAASLLPSDLNSYYQQASEAQGKSKAYEGLVKTSPELFGLTEKQSKSFIDFASKLPPIAVPEFYQMALKGGMQKQELASQTARTQIGISPAMGELELKKQQLLQSKVKSDEFMKAFDAVNNLFNQFGK